MRNISVLLLVIIVSSNCYLSAQSNKDFEVPKLSNAAQVSLLTVGLGTETYQLFGHSAIRVKDSIRGWDFVYNYGTFDFSDPDFLIKFIKGKLLYYESIETYSEFFYNYQEQNRTIYEQIFKMDSVQKQKIFEFLTINAREENKYYKYDFLFDNCATRPRDILSKVAYKSKLKYKSDVDDESTYRQLIDRHNTNEWLDFGMDLLIGLPTDKKAGIGRTFLPYELMQLYDGATLENKNIVISNQLILDTIPSYTSKNWITPSLIFWSILILLVLSNIYLKNNTIIKIIGIINLSVLGILGCLLLFMWLGTDHLSTKWNLNILWAMPLNLLAIFLFFENKVPQWIFSYFKIYRLILIFLIVFWCINPQTYHIAVLPLILINIFNVSILLPVNRTKH